MSFDNVLGLIFTLAVMGYLVVALLFPERLG